jgi:transcriptional regulator with GAF, ATPase, and Fis domain
MEMVRQVAPLESPVLLLGETGVGKEVLANAIHNLSHRRSGPLIRVNCGAIPETLMDSELFGHEKGAFTGAISRKRGRFERAHGGTIFLDEIGELPPEAQVRLLRVLQDKEIERVGGSETIQIDIRVIAATHRNLERMLAQGNFRDDLYFRLRVFPIAIPPLRQRHEDIPALVQHFIQKKSREMKLSINPVLAPGALDRLIHYAWPGNARELENAIERELILSKGSALSFDSIAAQGQANENHQPPAVNQTPNKPMDLDLVMAAHIRNVLKMCNGRVEGEKGAAGLLKIHPSTLRKRMKKLNIAFGRKAKWQ